MRNHLNSEFSVQKYVDSSHFWTPNYKLLNLTVTIIFHNTMLYAACWGARATLTQLAGPRAGVFMYIPFRYSAWNRDNMKQQRKAVSLSRYVNVLISKHVQHSTAPVHVPLVENSVWLRIMDSFIVLRFYPDTPIPPLRLSLDRILSEWQRIFANSKYVYLEVLGTSCIWFSMESVIHLNQNGAL